MMITYVDQNGKVTIPKFLREHHGIGVGGRVLIGHDGTSITITPAKQTWEDCVKEWYGQHYKVICNSDVSFVCEGDITFCAVYDPIRKKVCSGVAKRHKNDTYDTTIAKVAAYAKAARLDINKLIGWEG